MGEARPEQRERQAGRTGLDTTTSASTIASPVNFVDDRRRPAPPGAARRRSLIPSRSAASPLAQLNPLRGDSGASPHPAGDTTEAAGATMMSLKVAPTWRRCVRFGLRVTAAVAVV